MPQNTCEFLICPLLLLALIVRSKPDSADQIKDKQGKYHSEAYSMDAIVSVLVLKPYNGRMYQTYCQANEEAKHQTGNQSDPALKIHEVSGIVPGISSNGLIHDIACDKFRYRRYQASNNKYRPGLFDLKQSEYPQDNKESDAIDRKPRSK